MGFLDFPWTWLIVGLMLGAGFFALAVYLRSHKILVKWYEWLIGAIGLLLLLFAIQNMFAAFIEFETRPGWTFLWAIGIPGIILIILAWQLVRIRQRRTS